MCIAGDCKIRIRNTEEEIILKEGNSTLIPAAIADYDVIPLNNISKVLDAFIDNKDRSLPRKMTRFLHLTQK
jgi:mannose-6-phosphate isomerase